MPRTHQPHAAEYRRRIIELARAGRSIKELAREFEPSANAIREWVKQAALDEGLRSDGLTTTEREELTRLRRENRMLREEREILAKAAPGVCHEHEHELVMLYRRWELASRSRPAGAGFKPPGAAAHKRRGSERLRKSHL
jgi:transposase